MSTRFIQAINKTTDHKSMFHDTDSPLELFAEIVSMNATSGQTMDDWTFYLLNYKGEVINQNYDWKTIHVDLRLGDLIKNFVPTQAGK